MPSRNATLPLVKKKDTVFGTSTFPFHHSSGVNSNVPRARCLIFITLSQPSKLQSKLTNSAGRLLLTALENQEVLLRMTNAAVLMDLLEEAKRGIEV